MSEYSELSHPENPRHSHFFNEENIRRVQHGVDLDLATLESPEAFAVTIDTQYRLDEIPEKKAELLRLQRFASLATSHMPDNVKAQASKDFYLGELLGLDVLCRLAGNEVFPSGEIQRFAFDIRNKIPNYMDGVGEFDMATLQSKPVPKNAAFSQEQRTAEWGKSLFDAAVTEIPHGDISLEPFAEIIVQLTGTLSEERATYAKHGYWLLVRNALAPSSKMQRNFNTFTPVLTSNTDQEPALSSDGLDAIYPELADTLPNFHYASLDALHTHLSYKFLHLKSGLILSDDEEGIKAQQQHLEQQANHLLETEGNLGKDAPISVSGEYFFHHPLDNGNREILYVAGQGKYVLRGQLANLTVKRAYTQKALSAYHPDSDISDNVDHFMPHIRLREAYQLDVDSGEIVETYKNPIEIPLLYNSVHFSYLTGGEELEP